LIASGYLEAAATMERECNVGLTQWIAADNIDLPYVLNDFEEYFEFKFQKKPVLVRRNPDHDEEG
jgi:katanin p60 ATPase-containing subunit A1